MVGYFGYNNLGDEAILQSIVSQLRAYPRPLSLVLFAHKAASYQSSFHGTVLSRKSFPALIAGISMVDIVVFAGGTLFQDRTSFRNLLYYLGLIVLARILGKKIILYSQGVEPFRYSLSKWLVKNAFLFCHTITVRDKESHAYLNELLGGKKRIQYTVDSAMMIAPYQTNNLYQNCIGINFMNIKQLPLDSIVRQLERFSEKYRRKFLYLPLSKEDGLIGREIKKRLPDSMMAIFEPSGHISTSLGVLKQMDMMVGCRLHSLILSAAVGVPFLGIHYHDKVESFAKDVKQKYVPFSDLQTETFYSNLVEVFENRTAYRNQLNALVRDLKEQSRDNLINTILLKYDKNG
ncbi:MAG: polysaccharide pyruvyl transferase CsaB [Candidatus Margulisiibacteriota bacterium]